MKRLLLLTALVLSYTAYCQPIKAKLTSAIEKIETEKLKRYGERADTIHVDIQEYAVMSLKNWRKETYDLYVTITKEYNEKIDSVLLVVKQQDSLNHTHIIDLWVKEANREKEQSSGFDRKAYLKNKYETADSSIQVYKVLYRPDYITGSGKVEGDKVYIGLYVKDLSEVYSY